MDATKRVKLPIINSEMGSKRFMAVNVLEHLNTTRHADSYEHANGLPL